MPGSVADKHVKQLKDWCQLLSDIRQSSIELSSQFALANDSANPQHLVSSNISLAQFFTFSSITILISQAHYTDAFSLLRTLYEGHLHLWNICNGDISQAERFIHLATIQKWRIASEIKHSDDIADMKTFFSDEKMRALQKEYEAAIKYFKSRPGKIPRNYTDISNENLAGMIDASETSSHPLRKYIHIFRRHMHIRVYSAGSEYIHRSAFGIMEGFTLIQDTDEKGAVVPFPNPSVGIETAWWSSMIMIDGLRWYAQLLNIDFPETLIELYKQTIILAVNWLFPNGLPGKDDPS
jgi:hypothetical protein